MCHSHLSLLLTVISGELFVFHFIVILALEILSYIYHFVSNSMGHTLVVHVIGNRGWFQECLIDKLGLVGRYIGVSLLSYIQVLKFLL